MPPKNCLTQQETEEKRKKNIEKRERKTKNKKKTNNNNIFLLLLFYIPKSTFCQKTYLEKLSYVVTFILQFFAWEVNGNAVIKYQRPYRYGFC